MRYIGPLSGSTPNDGPEMPEIIHRHEVIMQRLDRHDMPLEQVKVLTLRLNRWHLHPKPQEMR
jgi:hypothetical protein